MIVAGIDPGAKNVGFVVREYPADTIVESSTFVCPEHMDTPEWARTVSALLKEHIEANYAGVKLGIEGVSDPKGFKGGQKQLLNPKYIIRAGIVYGALLATFPDAVVIKPGGHGSKPADAYPPELSGRRPKTLNGVSKGAGTRNHEKSAYDIAEQTFFSE